MKFILIILLTSGALRAQVPHIDYMIADEAKSQLQIHGTFGPDTTGFVIIENTKQTVRSWSDTMVICDLPDSGAGSGGHVTVQQMTGTSNERMLSIFKISVFHSDWYYGNGGNNPRGYFTWYILWRIDLMKHHNNDSLRKFEIAKVSYGNAYDPFTTNSIDEFWFDSANYKSSGISVTGTINLSGFTIKLDTTIMIFANPFGPTAYNSASYNSKIFSFDTLGNVFGYSDMIVLRGDEKTTENQISGEIFYPPSTKSTVSQFLRSPSDLIKILSHIGSEDHLISFEAEEPLGETTTSLYSIDGRMLKQEKISIPSAGIYSFDVSGIKATVVFLVLKTQKGIVAKKVLF